MRRLVKIIKSIFHAACTVTGAAGLTLAFFLVLPLMQAIHKSPTEDLVVRTVDTAELEPPPPPPEEPEPEEQPEPEEKPPELNEEAPPLDLQQLEMALNPGGPADSWMQGDFATKLKTVAAQGEDLDEVFSMADLDQRPRVIYQPAPTMSKEVRKHAPGTVYILFVVNKDGRVGNVKVQKSDHPALEKAAVSAVKRWKFEPGKRQGKSVRFRMRVPITFTKGDNR